MSAVTSQIGSAGYRDLRVLALSSTSLLRGLFVPGFVLSGAGVRGYLAMLAFSPCYGLTGAHRH